jgi:phospholipid/cholesterol/gamma-HCH transport system substrate-binding protein
MPRTRSLKWSELKLGAVGILAVALATALIFAVGGQGGFFWQRYPLHTRFDEVGGLKPGAVVRLNGLEVGKVTRVDFAGAQVEVGMEVSRSVRHLITSDSDARMGTLSLLGEPIVDVRAAATGTALPDGAYVTAVAAGGIPELASTAARSLDAAGALIHDVRAGHGSIGRLFEDETLAHELEALVASAGRLARGLEHGEGTLGALARDPAAYQSLQATLASLEQVAARLQAGEGALGRLLTDDRLYEQVAGLTARVDRIVGELEAGQGTAGQLLSDPELYRNANLAVTELRDLVADIRADPRKYLSVRVSVF